MAILAISKLGQSSGRRRCLSARRNQKAAFQQLIDDMFETMYDEPGIGLAAPQVGRSQQLVVMDCSGEGGFPKTVLINPTIQFTDLNRLRDGKAVSVSMGCGQGDATFDVRVTGLDRNAKPFDFEASGLYAVCIQHELDHVIGKLFIDRMTDFSTLTQMDEFQKYWQKEPASAI